jgi:GT2 family glycosyltransferase
MTKVSVIVPVHDDAANLRDCLAALQTAAVPGMEIVVVDDASRDDAVGVATAAGARIVRIDRNVGAAAARNRGVAVASGDLVVFVDADVCVSPDAVTRLVGVLETRPDLAAVFGSYDATPRARSFVSQYRNLLHHFVHQEGDPDAWTFWAGCGAIRRAVFDAVGGFDERAYARAVEDIELGYRMRAAGHRIALDRDIQATHLKRWTLASVLRTDLVLRAVPWSRLIMERRPPAALNVRSPQKVSVALSLASVALLLAGVVRPAFLWLSLGAVLGVIFVNRRLLRSFARVRGTTFAVATVPMLLLHYLEGGLGYGWAVITQVTRNARGGKPPSDAPVR